MGKGSISEAINHFERLIDKLVPAQSIDCVILGYQDNQLKVLLLKWLDRPEWALPGGFIYKNEDMDEAAVRVLKERTGLDSIYLSQFKSFGRVDRRDHDRMDEMFASLSVRSDKVISWFRQRFITTGYFALTNIEKSSPQPDMFSERCEWVSISNLPSLLFDHGEIIKSALSFIRIRLNYLPFGDSLLPQKFTMGDLQNLYEEILGRELDRGNFQKKMLKLEIFIRLEKQLTGGAHKAPYLYKFDQEKYQRLLERGIGFI